MFHIWWEENLVKHRKVSKYYETDCRFSNISGPYASSEYFPKTIWKIIQLLTLKSFSSSSFLLELVEWAGSTTWEGKFVVKFGDYFTNGEIYLHINGA